MIATYISTNSFSVVGDRIIELYSGRRLKLDCGLDSIRYSTVLLSSYIDSSTVVLITEDVITTNLVTALYGIVGTGETGSLPTHTHIGNDLGGNLKFVWLEDTPSTYSGIEGNYLRATSSGIEAIAGLVLKAEDNSEWLLKVTNSGTLYTEYYSGV